jgi:multidrug efflux system outer membrane protein
VVLNVITDVAQAYFELLELDLELEIAKRTRDAFQGTLDLFMRKLVGGVGNKLATSRAEAALADAAATIPDVERQIVAKENQLSILLGRQQLRSHAALVSPGLVTGRPPRCRRPCSAPPGRPGGKAGRGGQPQSALRSQTFSRASGYCLY